jgi:hypothetical protein
VSAARYLSTIRLPIGIKNGSKTRNIKLYQREGSCTGVKTCTTRGTKLHQLIKPKLVEHDIKLGRGGLFNYLRQEGLLVKAKKSYIKTMFSKYWMKKHPNLLKDKTPTRPEEIFVSDITYVQSNEHT